MIIMTFIIVLGFSVQPLFLPKKQNKDEGKSKIIILKLLKESVYDQIKELEMEYKEEKKIFDPEKVYKGQPNPTKI